MKTTRVIKTINLEKKINLLVIDEEDIPIVDHAVSNYRNKAIQESFLINFGFNISDIISYGNTKEVNRQLTDKIIPIYSNPFIAKTLTKNYMCYVSSKPVIPIHEDSLSSWKCLMSTINNPKYVIIYNYNGNK